MDAITPLPWTDFRAEILTLYEPPMRSSKTLAGMRRALDRVEDLGMVRSTTDLGPVVIAALVKRHPPELSPRTLLGILRCVRVACNYAMTTRRLAVSPFVARPLRSWVPPVGPPTGKRHLGRDEIKRILDLASADSRDLRGWAQWKARRLQALVATLAYCGLRAGEALNLHVGDVMLDVRCIVLVDRGRSGGHGLKTAAAAQPVPIPSALTGVLEEWLEHRLDAPPGFQMPAVVPWMFPGLMRRCAWTGGAPGAKPVDAVKALGRRAGVEGATLQSLRRSLATHLEAHGTGQAMITRILRHTSPMTTKAWYQQADVKNMVDAVDDLDFTV